MKFIDLWLKPLAWLDMPYYDDGSHATLEDRRIHAWLSIALVVTVVLLALLIFGAVIA